DDELASGRGEEPVGDVDRDALFALGFQSVHQQRKIRIVARGAVFLRIPPEGGKLVLVDLPRIGEKTAYQGRLAVIDRSAGQEAQERFALLLGDVIPD